MMKTAFSNTVRRTIPHLRNSAISVVRPQATASFSVLATSPPITATTTWTNNKKTASALPTISVPSPHTMWFSTVADPSEVTVQEGPGHVTKKLRVLNMKTVKLIMEELKAVDENSDGRIDTSELKDLLRKHDNAFTEDEIVEIGELFYAGKSGGSVSFERFIEAIDRVVQREESDAATAAITPNGESSPLALDSCGNEYLFYKSHGNMDWNIELTHTAPQSLRDRMAYQAVRGVRFVFDLATGWNGVITTDKVLNRTIFLETIAAVPGMVAAIVRHFKSLRTMQRDGGMLQMFLDEANNERMHLLTFVRMKDPNMLVRAAVIGGQFGFGSLFLLAYILDPKFCHRFVGYVEEEACSTYTKIIHAIEASPADTPLGAWRTQIAPGIARSYWKLGEQGTVLDVMYAVRADEAEHRDVNHLCSTFVGDGQQNPVSNTEEKLNTMLLKYVHDLMERDPHKEAAILAAGPPAGGQQQQQQQ